MDSKKARGIAPFGVALGHNPTKQLAFCARPKLLAAAALMGEGRCAASEFPDTKADHQHSTVDLDVLLQKC